MAIVRGKQARWRVVAAHVMLWIFLAVTLFPLLAVVSISLRPGNFATGSLIPTTISLEHWQLALGIPYQAADGSLVQPPFPVLTTCPPRSPPGRPTSWSATPTASRSATRGRTSGSPRPSRR